MLLRDELLQSGIRHVRTPYGSTAVMAERISLPAERPAPPPASGNAQIYAL
jgi:hypothetical protein